MTKVTQAHIDARTEAILDAAMKMIVQKGVHGATIEEIAAEAGLSAGAIYRYFASKEDVLRAVIAQQMKQDRALMEQALATTDSVLHALLSAVQAVWAGLKSEKAREETILSLETTLAAARQSAELGAERRHMRKAEITMLEQCVRQAQEAGEIDPAVDGRALAVMLLACHLGAHQLDLELQDGADTDALLAGVIKMLHKFSPQVK